MSKISVNTYLYEGKPCTIIDCGNKLFQSHAVFFYINIMNKTIHL